MTEIYNAAKQGDKDKIKALIAQGHNIDDRWPEGQTCLTYAACMGNLTAVTTLLDCGANIETPTEWGKTAFYCALVSFHDEVAAFLLEKGCVIQCDCVGFNAALNWTSKKSVNNNAILLKKILQEDDSYINSNIPENGARACVVAIEANDSDLLLMLLQKGVSLTKRVHYGWTLLQHAVGFGADRKIIDILIEQGSDLEACATYTLSYDNIIDLVPANNRELAQYFKEKLSFSKINLQKIYEDFRDLIVKQLRIAKQKAKKLLVIMGEDHGPFKIYQLNKLLLRAASDEGILDLNFEQEKLPDFSKKIKNCYDKTYYTASKKYNMRLHPVDIYQNELANHANPIKIKNGFSDFSPLEYPAELLGLRNKGMAEGVSNVNQDAVFIVGACHLKGLLDIPEEKIDTNLFHVVPISAFSFSVHKGDYPHSLRDFAEDQNSVIQIVSTQENDGMQSLSLSSPENVIAKWNENNIEMTALKKNNAFSQPNKRKRRLTEVERLEPWYWDRQTEKQPAKKFKMSF